MHTCLLNGKYHFKQIANAKNLDDVMLMYKVIESSNDYEKA